MKQAITWFKTQWEYKMFRVLTVSMLILTFILGAEFYFFQYGILKIFRYFILLWMLLMIAWIDQKSKRIPNTVLVFLVVTRTMIIILECIFYKDYWMSILISAGVGAILGGGMFLICYLLTRGGVGAGDVKLFTVLGYYVGGGAIFTVVFLIVLTAAFYSIGALVLKKTNLKQEIPFAPFILAGTLLSMILGV